VKDWQQRVVAEQEELDKKVAKLHDFCFNNGTEYFGLPIDERFRLENQLDAMKIYERILRERIRGFPE